MIIPPPHSHPVGRFCYFLTLLEKKTDNLNLGDLSRILDGRQPHHKGDLSFLLCRSRQQKVKESKVFHIVNMYRQYLGEPRVKPENVVAGLSVCQGYDAKKAMEVRSLVFSKWRS